MRRMAKLKEIFTGSYTTVLGLELCEEEVRLALVRTGAPAQVLQTARRELPPHLRGRAFCRETEAAADFLRLLLQENKIVPQNTPLVAIPGGGQLSTVLVDLPAMPERELREALKWELPQHFAYAEGEYCSAAVLAAFTGEVEEMRRQLVLGAALPLEDAQGLAAICALLEMRLLKIEAGFLALACLSPQEETFLLLEAGAEDNLLTLFHRGFPVARAHVGDQAERLVEEIGEQLGEARRLWNIEPALLVVHGAEEAFRKALEESLGQSGRELTVQSTAFNGRVQWEGGLYGGSDIAEQLTIYGVAIAAASGSAAYSLNLLPPLPGQGGQLLRLWKYCLAVGAAAAVFFLGYSLAVYGLSVSRLEEVRGQTLAAAPLRTQYERERAMERRLAEREKIMRELRRRNLPWGAVLTELGEAAPPGCWFHSVQESSARETALLEIQGKAESMECLHAFLETLRQSGRYGNIRLAKTEEAPHGSGMLLYTLFLHVQEEAGGQG